MKKENLLSIGALSKQTGVHIKSLLIQKSDAMQLFPYEFFACSIFRKRYGNEGSCPVPQLRADS